MLVRQDPAFRRRITVAGIVAGLLAITTAIITVGNWGLTWIVPSLIVPALLWGIWATVALARYRCSTCGARIGTLLPTPDVKPGQSIIFQCKSCNIGWDTGLKRIHSDSPGD